MVVRRPASENTDKTVIVNRFLQGPFGSEFSVRHFVSLLAQCDHELLQDGKYHRIPLPYAK